MSNDTEKIRHHIELIVNAISDLRREQNFTRDSWAFDAFAIRQNWGVFDPRSRATDDILEEYDKLLATGEPVGWGAFERELRDKVGLADYTVIKQLIIAVWKSGRLRRICFEYAKANSCVEFNEILDSEPEAFWHQPESP